MHSPNNYVSTERKATDGWGEAGWSLVTFGPKRCCSDWRVVVRKMLFRLKHGRSEAWSFGLKHCLLGSVGFSLLAFWSLGPAHVMDIYTKRCWFASHGTRENTFRKLYFPLPVLLPPLLFFCAPNEFVISRCRHLSPVMSPWQTRSMVSSSFAGNKET